MSQDKTPPQVEAIKGGIVLAGTAAAAGGTAAIVANGALIASALGLS